MSPKNTKTPAWLARSADHFKAALEMVYFSLNDLMAATGLSRGCADRIAAELVRRGELEKIKKSHRVVMYRKADKLNLSAG